MHKHKTTYYLIFIGLLIALSACQKRDKRYLVISKIKNTTKLATTKTTIDKVVIGSKNKNAFGLVKVSNSTFVAYTQATVITGIDMNKLQKNDVQIKGRRIELKLPPVEVLDFKYPFDKFRIDPHLSDNKMLSTIDVIDMENYYRKAENDIRKQLPYMGITAQTKINTRKLLESLLSNLGYDEIYISYKTDTTPLIPEINWKKYLNTHE